jgi:hypothetical protein
MIRKTADTADCTWCRALLPGVAAGHVTLLQRMAEPSQLPTSSSRGRRQPGDGRTGTAGLPLVVTLAAVIAGTALLGAATGFIWAAVAPRALVVVVSRGSADVVNPETNAFIVAEAWFTLLTVAGGILSGLLGHALAVRRDGAPAIAAVLVGGLAAALIAKWIGQRSGAAAFNSALAAGRPGALLHAPLAPGGLGALAFWPLAAGLVAGGIEAVVAWRERRAAQVARRTGGTGMSGDHGVTGPGGATGAGGATGMQSFGPWPVPRTDRPPG